MAFATFGAGCFWGVEAAFRKISGVKSTKVGYSGGDLRNPCYEDICTGQTGHAEVVQIEYDDEQVSYDQLLDTFWKSHDPTQLNRQGPDIGTQYRSVIFFHEVSQEKKAKRSLYELNHSKKSQGPIVTQILPVNKFYRAEEYHQQYLEKRGLSKCH